MKINNKTIFHCNKHSKFITKEICDDCYKTGIAGFTDHVMCKEYNISMVENGNKK